MNFKSNRIELNSTSSIYTLAISYILLNWEIDWEIQYEKTVVNCADMNSSAFLFQIHTCIPDLGNRGNCFRKNNAVNFLAPLSAKAESVALGIGCIEYRVYR